MADDKQELAVIGAGISGLAAAIAAVDQGQDASKIHLYEGSQRLGGKIQSVQMGDKVVNAGAEFVDNGSQMQLLCNKLGVNLIKCEDQEKVQFQRPSGAMLTDEEFFRGYSAIEHRIFHDKQEIAHDPDGPLARQLNNLSFGDYLHVLGATVPVEADRSFIGAFLDWWKGNTNRVDPDVIEAAISAYCSEVGQSPKNISALQFVHEASSQPRQFLASDCGWRVEGGMENVVHAAKAYLIQHGMKEENFHLGAKLKQVAKNGETTALTFDDPAIGTVQAGKTLFALPAYGLSQIQGLESIGVSEKSQAILRDAQYTNNVKFMVKVKDGVTVPKENFFGKGGVQSWVPEDGIVTFFAHAGRLGKDETSKALVTRVLESYAAAHGKKMDDIFDLTTGNVVFNNPGKAPCYATPRVGQALQLEQLRDELAQLPSNVGIVGTFLPGKSGEIGFMDNGIIAAQNTCAELYSPEKQRPLWLEQTLAKPQAPDVPTMVAGLEQQAQNPDPQAGRPI